MMNMRSYAPLGHRAIATSTDGGQTWSKIWHHLELPEPTCQAWPVSRLICAVHSAYSCLTVLPDKSIGLLYDRDQHATVTLARFTLDWLSRRKDQKGVAR